MRDLSCALAVACTVACAVACAVAAGKRRPLPRAVGESTGFAMATCVRKPLEFDTWLRHHFRLGAACIFLRVEDSPEVGATIGALPPGLARRVVATYASTAAGRTQWWELQERQAAFFRDAVRACCARHPQIGWIFQNIDDDELLYTHGSDMIRLLDGVPATCDACFFPTVEAVFPKSTPDETRVFRTNAFVRCDGRRLCTSYYGGKSAGRLRPDLRSDGPHRVRARRGTHAFDDSVACVLHFESANYRRWRTKFERLRVRDGARAIPEGFDFYNESVARARAPDGFAYYQRKKETATGADADLARVHIR